MTDYAKVDDFLASLSPWEQLHARARFRTLTIAGLASLPDLPSELVCLIASFLRLPDIFAARQVSRSWRAAWTHGAVVSGVCHYFFPGLLELYNARTHWGSARELFDAAARRYLTRYYARPSRTAFVFWDAGWTSGVFTNRKELDARNPPSFRGQVCFYAQGPPVFYCRGILAWQPAKSYVIVDDLRSCRRSVCMLTPILMSGQLISLHAVSERLLIFAATSNGHNYHTVQIWHIGRSEWKRVALPGPLAMSYADDDRAAFVTRQGLVITWSWDGHASEIDNSTSLNRAPDGYDTGRSLPGVILHPNHPHTLYLASIARSTTDAVLHRQRDYIMSVVRYEHGIPVHRFTERIASASLSGFHHPSVEGSFTFALPCSKMSHSGLYNMGTLLMPSYGHDIARVVELASVGFNVLTESFVQREYVATRGSRMEVHGLHHFDAATWGLSRDMQHISTWVEEHGFTTRWFDLRNVDVGAAKRRAAAAGAPDVSAYMRAVEKVVSSAGPCRVYGDEDFQVFVTKWGILVWAFTNTELRERLVSEESVLHVEGMEPVRSSDLRPLAS